MSVTSLRPIARLSATPLAAQAKGAAQPVAGPGEGDFGAALLRAGYIDPATYIAAMGQTHVPFAQFLVQRDVMPVQVLYQLLAEHWGIGLADLTRTPAQSDLMAQIDPAVALAQHWLPWRRLGATTVIVCAFPEEFATIRPYVTRIFGHVTLATAPCAAIEAQILQIAGRSLARRAETRLAIGDSCRNFTPNRIFAPLVGLVLAIGAAFWLAPMASLMLLIGAAALLAYGLSCLKWAAALAEIWRKPARQTPNAAPVPLAGGHLSLVPTDADLPMISIMVPLYRESRIVARLIRRLDRLEYPRRAMEVLLLIEDNDSATATALAALSLPPWVRVLTVPGGDIRTKPRALNYGLDHCKGQIIGVYDAEDAPEPGQLNAVAQGFAAGPPNLGCLQGRLDYYNPHRNWMARCFTMEYAAWWRIVLPGYAGLGLPIPLGGTTLFFRRDVLVALGAWDAHNVTEDADLGLRLARKGYFTQLLDSTTFEEANAQVLPWIKQRSRWIKGYIMTYATHMRAPSALLRDIGLWQFLAVQIIFAGTVLQALFAPLLFALWTLAFGLIDPGVFGLPNGVFAVMAAAGVLAECGMIMVGYAALRRTSHHISPLWLPTMVFYNLLASLAAYKAVYEVLTKPFYWDKTAHGLFDG